MTSGEEPKRRGGTLLYGLPQVGGPPRPPPAVPPPPAASRDGKGRETVLERSGQDPRDRDTAVLRPGQGMLGETLLDPSQDALGETRLYTGAEDPADASQGRETVRYGTDALGETLFYTGDEPQPGETLSYVDASSPSAGTGPAPQTTGVRTPAAFGATLASAEGDEARGGTIARPGLARRGSPFEAVQGKLETLAGKTAYRAYADGVLITSNRERVAATTIGDTQAVPLPYASGDVIKRIGDYDVLGELGRGGMGVVYKAYSLRLCRPCALKLMIPGPHVSTVHLVRFQNEAMLAARLSHPNIVQVFDAGEDNGQFYFVMAFVKGQSLLDYAADPKVDSLTLTRIAAKCARAMHYAHQHGIVHRDIKPDNILVDENGEPHITDFGIAANVQTDRRLTNEGAIMGTPAYMSPEQVNGEVAHIGPASDIYSLGATLFHVLAGREVFAAKSVVGLLQKACVEDPQAPSAVARMHSRREISLDLDTIVLKTLEKQSARRYPDALSLALDLEAFVEGRPVQARPISSFERLQKLVRRNRAAFAVTSVVFATLLLVGLAFGAVTVFNIERTVETIRQQDVQAGLEQAATLERAIRVNMLQGRADVVRELVGTLRDDPLAKSIDVVRVDRSFAYTDLSTRKTVERRLADPDVIKAIERTRPEFLDKIEEVKRLAFRNIDENRGAVTTGVFDYDRLGWEEIVNTVEPRTERGFIDGEPVLTVFKPLENSEDCQVCHGGPEEGGYGKNLVRAVLVVRRSQALVEARVEDNRRTALWVGISTTAAILAVMWGFVAIFGLRFRRQRYAAA